MVVEKTCKGFAYMANSDKYYVIFGETEKEIIDQLSAWNRTRLEETKYVYCNIGTYNEEIDKYVRYQKYDVTTGRNISPIELKLPSMSKEEFQQTIKEFKGQGAKFHSLHKKWYVSPDNKNLEYFRPYMAEKMPQEQQKESEIRTLQENVQKKEQELYDQQPIGQSEQIRTSDQQPAGDPELLNLAGEVLKIDIKEINLSLEKTKILQDLVRVDLNKNKELSDLTKMILESMHAELDHENRVIYPDRQSAQQEPEETVIEEADYVLSIPKDPKDGQSPIDIFGDHFNLHFPSVSADRVRETAAEYLERRETQLQKEPFLEYKAGDPIDAYRPVEIAAPEHPEQSFIIGIRPVKGTVQAVNPDDTGQKVYMVENEEGFITHVAETELYPPQKAEVLMRAMNEELPAEKFDIMANPRFSSAQMEEIRLAFKDGLSMEQVKGLAEPKLEAWQMDIARIGLQHGLGQEDLEQLYTAQGKDWMQCRNELNGMITANRQQRIQELAGQGFSADMKMIKSMEQLNCLTNRNNSLQDICNAFKEGIYKDTPAGDIVNSLAREFQNQEIQQQMMKPMEPEP